MAWYEYLIIAFSAAFVAGVVIWRIVRKKQGKSGCDCGCSACGGACPHCSSKDGRAGRK